MDKFSELQKQIENIIASLDRQIKAKQERIKDLNQKIDDNTSHLYDLNEIFDRVSKERDILSEVEGKSILIHLIKEELKDLVKSPIENVKNKQWGMALLSVFIVIAFIFTFCFSWFLSGSLVKGSLAFLFLASFYFFTANFREIEKLSNIKKNNTLSGLSTYIEEIEARRNMYKNNIKEYKAESKKLYEEMQALQTKKAYYEDALKKVLADREQAITQKAQDILNQSFEEQAYSEIIRRIRQKEKNNAHRKEEKHE